MIALVAVLVLLVLRVGLDLWLGRQLNQETARLEQKYGTLNLQSMAPGRLDPDKNRARVVRAAGSLTAIGGSAGVSYESQKLAAFAGAASEQVNPELRAQMARVVERNGLALQVATEVLNRPKSNWEIDYPEANRMPALMDIRGLGSVLAAAARTDADAGRADAALQRASVGFGVAQSLAPEPLAILQMMRIGIANDQLRAIKQSMAAGDGAPTTLAKLASVLAEGRTPDPVWTPLVAELKFANQMWQRMEGGRSVEDYLPGSPSPAWASPGAWLFRPVMRAFRLRYLHIMERLIDSEANPPFARTQPIPLPSAPRWWQLRARFDAAFLPGLDRMAAAGYRYLSSLNVAEAAVALRRFRIDNGRYPEALTQLAPRYITRVPIDPFTGRPPQYTRHGNGFTLTGHGPKVWSSVADHALLEWKIDR